MSVDVVMYVCMHASIGLQSAHAAALPRHSTRKSWLRHVAVSFRQLLTTSLSLRVVGVSLGRASVTQSITSASGRRRLRQMATA